uniref:Ubiquitin associated protein 1 like n=1 Tax=Oryzias latipes TaxID=8090 RepID=A0A3P9JZ29_ORYLA
MDGVPLKIPQAAATVEVIENFQVTLPDYLAILRDTEYEFSLENWMLTGLQNGFTHQQQPQPTLLPSELKPSCPPYWMMFSSPQQSRLASRHRSDFWEPNPRQRSNSLNPAVLRAKFTISDSEDESEPTTPADKSSPEMCLSEDSHPAARCQHGQRKLQKAFVPDLLNPPSCLSSLPHQRRKNLRQCSLSATDSSALKESNKDSPSAHIVPGTRDDALNTTISDLSSTPSESTCLGFENLPANKRPRGLLSGLDSSAEVLSALSTEERALVGAITTQGYSLRAAIIALQKKGQQTPDQMLTYLIACEHLCQLGYDISLVEEALEMFQNCETKAEEFLCLLSQFNEMGFQQNTIKEVLLVHENHRERALEELMMRVS